MYVDDILIAAQTQADVIRVKEDLTSRFEAHDLGNARVLLGMAIERNRAKSVLEMSQERLTAQLVDKYGLGACKRKIVPQSTSTELSRISIWRVNPWTRRRTPTLM